MPVEIPTSLDEGGRQLAGHILNAAALGDDAAIAQLIDPLDADQLRSLVSVLAAQVDQAMPETEATGPAAVCELAASAAAEAFATTAEAILSSGRTQNVSDARAVAMTVAREAGLSLPAIGQHFNKDHGSVIHAVRRTSERPRLANAAARISEHVNSRYAARLPRSVEDPAARERPVPTSSFQPSGVVEHAVVAAAKEFGTTPEVLLGTDRTRTAADARAVAMTAARMHGQSLPRIAGHFDRDHTTVLHATRRIEKTPPLQALAARIAADLPTDVDEHQAAAIGEPTWEKVTTLPSRGAREARRARDQQPAGAPALRVAP